TFLYFSSLISCRAVKVFPKRILAFQSTVSYFLKAFFVTLTPSAGSGRSVILILFEEGCAVAVKECRPSLPALLAGLAGSRSVRNHSCPSRLVFRLILELCKTS